METFPGTIRDALFAWFAAALASGWPEGVTATEWATLVNRDVHRVRVRLDALVAEDLLVHDHVRDRYGVLFRVPFDS